VHLEHVTVKEDINWVHNDKTTWHSTL